MNDVQLNDGKKIPQIGLGVFRAGDDAKTERAVLAALEAGYRHVDTASVYGNEAGVGAALRRSGIPRDEVWITTKLWNADQGYESTLSAFQKSLDQLQLDYVDLYLLHWPVPQKRLESWKALEELHGSGRARSIGVSNFMVDHLEELLAQASVSPAINQIELHPFCQQRTVVDWCRDHNIAIEAYSPLTKGQELHNPVLSEVAQSAGRSVAQVLIRWSLDRGFVCLPKSSNPERILENFELDFELNEDQTRALDKLDQAMHTAWDPRQTP